MLKFEKKKLKNCDFIYDFNFLMYNISGFGVLEKPTKWKQRLYSMYYHAMHSLYFFFICLFVIDAYLVRNDKEKLNLNLCVTIVTAASVVKIWSLMSKLNVIVEIRRRFRENFNLPFVGHQNAHKEIKEERARQIYLITKTLTTFAIPLAIIWITFPLIDPSSKERKYCLPFPISKDTTSPTFEIVYAFHAFTLTHFISNIMSNDILLMGFLIRICEHFDILIYNISKIKDVYPQLEYEKYVPGYADMKSDGEDHFDECVRENKHKVNADGKSGKLKSGKYWKKKETGKCLRQNIAHHRCILHQLEVIKYAYGGQMFIQMTAGALVISVVAFDLIVQSRKFNAPVFQQLLYVGAVLTDIFLLCYYGTQIGEKSEKVAEALYDIPWHEMDITNRKICSFMIAKCRRPPQLKARYVFNLNLETYLSLVRTSYNMMALLNEAQ